MEIRSPTNWRSRAVFWVSGLVIWLATSATTLVPPPVDAQMVERAVSGAEYLAGQVKSDPEMIQAGASEPDLASWLLVAGGATGPRYGSFAAYLSSIGYADTLVPVQDWMTEFTRALAAVEAYRESSEIRSMADIQAEMRALPILPLDADDKARRDRLMDELNLASIPDDERRAAGAAQGRIGALQTLFMQETGR
ncbi:MAG: hypothetical protein ACC619_04160 [Paracoccaceae bacterium]